MFDLYTWPTPNGRKVSILLEELELDYNIIPIDIDKGDQFSEKFKSISVDNKIPLINILLCTIHTTWYAAGGARRRRGEERLPLG